MRRAARLRQMVKGEQYLFSVDWWSLGVTAIELLTGKKPFKKKFQKYKNVDDKLCVCAPVSERPTHTAQTSPGDAHPAMPTLK